jgi:hypothetical protein
VVSIITPTPPSILELAMAPSFSTKLLEFRVTAGMLVWVILTDPVASMMILPLEEVLRAVLVAFQIVVSARTAEESVRAAVSRAAAAAESIKRCLINSAS